MDKTKATKIGDHLAAMVDASDDLHWTIRCGLAEFPSDPVEIWLPKDGDAVHWLNADALLMATAVGGTLKVTGRPVAGGDWSLEVGYKGGTLGQVVAHPGLRSAWIFSFPCNENFAVNGEIVYKGGADTADLDEAEKLARAIASRMLDAPARG